MATCPLLSCVHREEVNYLLPLTGTAAFQRLCPRCLSFKMTSSLQCERPEKLASISAGRLSPTVAQNGSLKGFSCDACLTVLIFSSLPACVTHYIWPVCMITADWGSRVMYHCTDRGILLRWRMKHWHSLLGPHNAWGCVDPCLLTLMVKQSPSPHCNYRAADHSQSHTRTLCLRAVGSGRECLVQVAMRHASMRTLAYVQIKACYSVYSA